MNSEIAKKFLNKFSNLPEEVQFYIDSQLQTDYIQKLNKKYNLPPGFLADLVVMSVVNDFNFRFLDKEIEKQIKDKKKSQELIIDFLGILFLPVDDYIEKVDIGKEIKKRGGRVELYEKYIDEVDELIIKRKNEEIQKAIKELKDLVDIEEEKEVALKIFKNNLVYILSHPDETINGGLIYLLDNKKEVKDELVKVLLDNQEKLTHKKFVLGGKMVRPTVGNWIKDFIKYYGTENFNNVVLTKYITTSPNTKILDEEEKKLVRKLLQVYRNIKFFPESMGDAPPEEWEIIPTERTGERLTKARRVSGPPETEEEKEMKTLKQMEEKYDEKSLERLALEEEIKKKRKIEELKIIANKYKEGSLERRAIEEEIRRLGD